MQLPRASTSALADGYCPAIVAETLASVSAVDAVACCAVVCRAGNPAAMKSEMPIAAIKGRALPIALDTFRAMGEIFSESAPLLSSPPLNWIPQLTRPREAGRSEGICQAAAPRQRRNN